MRLVRSLSAGLVDSGFASLGTFAVGVYAARFLEPATLGLFALHFAAFTLVATVSHQGIYIPLEASAAGASQGLRHVRRSLSLAWIPGVVAPLAFVLPALATPGSIHAGMGVTAAAAVLFSPVQDHLRRMLHLGGASSHAAAVSAVQATTAVTGLVLLHDTLSPAAVPFAALALANLLSLSVGLVFVGIRLYRLPPGPEVAAPPPFAELVGSGRWLLGAQLTSAAATFVAATLLGRLGSIEALGMADAARIVGRPVLVVTTGMTAVLGPRLMRAAAAGREGQGRRVGQMYQVAVAASVVGYVALFGWAHPLNPLSWLVPTAFALPFLVAATCLANGVTGLVLPARFEAIGGGRSRALLRVDARAGLAQVAIGCMAPLFQAFTVPLGNAAFAFTRLMGLDAVRKAVYAAAPQELEGRATVRGSLPGDDPDGATAGPAPAGGTPRDGAPSGPSGGEREPAHAG